MSVYAPIGTGYKGIPTFARDRKIITGRDGTQYDGGVDNRSPMRQVAGSSGSGLDWLKENGPGRYAGGNDDAANTMAVQQTRQAQTLRRPGQPAPMGSSSSDGTSSNGYNTAGIGYEHYHNALVNQAGELGPDGRYTGGYLKGMKPADARNYTQKQWLQLGPAGQPEMINKLSQVYGTPPQPVQPSAMGSSPTATPAAPAQATLPHQRQPSTTTPAPVGTGTVLKPATVAAPQPMPLPLPGRTSNDPALAARLRSTAPGATVLENGKPWTPTGATAPAAPASPPRQSLDTIAAGLQVMKGAKDIAKTAPTATPAPTPARLPLPKKPAAPLAITPPPPSSEFTPAQQAGNDRMASILQNSADTLGKPKAVQRPATISSIPLPSPETIGRPRATTLPLPKRQPAPIAAR